MIARKLLFVIFSMITFAGAAQPVKTTVSGMLREENSNIPLPFVNIELISGKDSAFIAGTITREDGRFTLPEIEKGSYFLKSSSAGYQSKTQEILVGQLSNFIDVGTIELSRDARMLNEVMISANKDLISEKMDKKTFTLAENISMQGGSALEAMKNLPGITISQEGKLELRGSDRVVILIDGRQTALTGFGGQSGLGNIPASAIEKIEIINNPSAKYDANGNAGIINIIYKKIRKEGFNGKVALVVGAGALWVKRDNYPTIRPQYQGTPKINPSISLNYRKNKINLFLQGDDLYTQTLNKNEFTDRFYDYGDTIKQQLKRNRTTNIVTVSSGIDWSPDAMNAITLSGLFSSEMILDRGDQPFFKNNLEDRQRLWQFLEDELKTTVMAMGKWQHLFKQPGRKLNAAFSYTFHREDEKYFFTNTLPTFVGLDSFKLLSDEHVADLNLDYVQPLKRGRYELGFKFRRREIPVNMQFKPGLNSPLDSSAGGRADYSETIPAVYGNYIFETNRFEVEAGLRIEYVKVNYEVDPGHPVYESDSYDYLQPFPSIRVAYKSNDNNRITAFYNRRVDRPNEVDIRIFPKYDDAEIIKVGNPALRPQFTQSFELGYKTTWSGGYVFPSIYHKRMEGTITRIGTIVPGSPLIYNVFQNAGKSTNTGIELMLSQVVSGWFSFNVNLNAYQHVIDSFSVVNKYPVATPFFAAEEKLVSGNVKFNGLFQLPAKWEAQLTAIYQAPDLVPQGKIFSRFSIDMGVKKIIQKGKGELFANISDVANTLRLKREIRGNGFHMVSTDYYETQVFRAGYSYKF